MPAHRKPPELLELHGRRPGQDASGRPIKHPPEPLLEPPSMPAYLTGAAAEVWQRAVDGWGPDSPLRRVDSDLLAVYCLLASRVIERLAGGRTVSSVQLREARALADSLGLSPAGRLRLAVPTPPAASDVSPLAALRNRREADRRLSSSSRPDSRAT